MLMPVYPWALPPRSSLIYHVRQLDPDVLAGFEIQGGSWGLAADRYQVLTQPPPAPQQPQQQAPQQQQQQQAGLLKEMSRTPEARIGRGGVDPTSFCGVL